jgi:hypothetical protein
MEQPIPQALEGLHTLLRFYYARAECFGICFL